MNFTDKVVIITGASSGIGLACAKEFASLGAKVVIASRNTEKIDKIAKELSVLNKCLAIKTDVSVEADCRHMVEKTIEEFGGIDYLINNAGISMRAIFDDVEMKVLHQVMNINFWGTVYCTKYALPYLQKSNGTLVGISSLAGFHGLPGRTAYSASKSAMQGFLECIRIENLKSGLHVLVLSAGFTSSNIRVSALDAHGNSQGETPRPEDRLMPPETVAKALVKAIRKRKRNKILTIEGKLMIFLQRILPEWVDNMIYKSFKKEPNSPLKE
jgi:short-subunit dehydrogenase